MQRFFMRYRPFIIFGCFLYVIIGTATYFWFYIDAQNRRYIEEKQPGLSPDVYFLSVVAIVLFSVAAFLFYYLNRSRASQPENPGIDLNLVLQRIAEIRQPMSGIDEIRKELSRIQSEMAGLATSQRSEINAEERAAIITAIVNNINSTINDEFLKGIDAKYSSSILKSNESNGLLTHFENLKDRLLRAIEYLEQRGNVNLIIGIVTTLGAVAGLYYIVFQTGPVNFDDKWQIIGHYVPRISFVVFVEVFAYFFLRLYKSNVEDVKYYHNELTNIDAKLIGLRSALLIGDDVSAKTIMTSLSKTERNYVLRRGETTSDLERAKLEGKGINDSLKQILGIFKIVSKHDKS